MSYTQNEHIWNAQLFSETRKETMNYEKQYVKSMMGLMLSVSLIAGGTISVYASDTTETATESTTEAQSMKNEHTPREKSLGVILFYGYLVNC